MPVATPPVQLNHVTKSQVGNQVEDMFRHNHSRCRSSRALRMLDQRPQRRPVQVIKMRMRNEHHVNGRKVLYLYPRLAQSFQDKKPAGKVGINNDILPANLQKKTGMADKGDTHFAVGNQLWFMRFAHARRDRRMPNQPAKLPGALSQSRILERLFQHEAALSCWL